jgi:hypothetical protein
MRRIKLALHIVLAFSAVGSGFVTGAWFASRQRANALLAAYPANRLGPPRPAVLLQNEKFRTVEEGVSALFSAHQEKSPLRRGFELYEAIQRLDAGQMQELVTRAAALPDIDRRQLLPPLVARWHELDSDAAAAWARPFLQHAFVAPGRWGRDEWAATAWCRAAPERALEEALRRPESLASEQIVRRRFSVWSANNPRAGIERLAALPAGGLRERALANALKQWGERNPAEAYAEISRLRDQRQFKETQRELLAKWAEKQSGAALSCLQQLLPALGTELYGNPWLIESFEQRRKTIRRKRLNGLTGCRDNARGRSCGCARGVGW